MPDSERSLFIALLRRARGTTSAVIRARLTAAGFEDIPRDGAVLLTIIVSYPGPESDGIIHDLGISELVASTSIDDLIARGYLEQRVGHDDGNRSAYTLTWRGRAVVMTVDRCLRTARWSEFQFRQGDIVISACSKSGLTWVQMICALLIFQTPDLPAPLSELSPWLDWKYISPDEVYAQLAAQNHRRFIKTHTPLNDITIDPKVTYIVVARHPLDAAVSMYHQSSNIDSDHSPESTRNSRTEQPRPSAREWLLRWIDSNDLPREQVSPMPNMMWHLSDAWARRGEPNVVLLHYDDLRTDLEGEMRRLATRLGMDVRDSIWPSLVKSATFDQMRAAADRLKPVGILKDNKAFFRRGTSGSGRELLTEVELARYYARAGQLAPPDLLAWLHRQDV